MKKILLSLVLGVLCSVPFAAKADGKTDFVILPGDVLQVNVWKEDGMDQEVLVLSDGTITYPLVGTVKVEGLSPYQLQEDIRQRLASVIPYAAVTVSVKSPLGHKVSVLGQVAKPGDVVLASPTRVMQALSQVGGLTPYADEDNIVIIRSDKAGEKHTIKFPYDDVSSGRKLDQDLNLEPGDVVVVPEDGLF